MAVFFNSESIVGISWRFCLEFITRALNMQDLQVTHRRKKQLGLKVLTHKEQLEVK